MKYNEKSTCVKFSDTSFIEVQAFIKSVEDFFQNRASEVGAAVFDKDDDLAVAFVTAASNLRAICYDISTQSTFAAKVTIHQEIREKKKEL